MESLEIILAHAGQTPSLEDRVRLADRKNAYFRELIASITPDDLLPGHRRRCSRTCARTASGRRSRR